MRRYTWGRVTPYKAKPKSRAKKMQKPAPCFQQGRTVTPFATPEDKFFDVTTDEHIRCIWITAYIEVIKTKSREAARMAADETLEDYMEKFSG